MAFQVRGSLPRVQGFRLVVDDPDAAAISGDFRSSMSIFALAECFVSDVEGQPNNWYDCRLDLFEMSASQVILRDALFRHLLHASRYEGF
jgi:hypothetical protein